MDNFNLLAEVPRPSHHEKKISNFLMKWAKEQGFEVAQDGLYNLKIEVPATEGFEKRPLCILQGDYSKEQYEAFYQSTLEPLTVAISQALSKKLFTRRERAFGNKIELYPKDLIFMTVSQTLEMIEKLAPTGGLFENEKRTALGLRPLPELEGKRYMSLNWIDANNADVYQVGKDNSEDNNENNQEDTENIEPDKEENEEIQ